MENLILELSQNRYYQPINYNPNNNLLFLYEFFRDIFDEFDEYIKIFSNPDFEYTQTDFTFIEREGDTMIIGSHLVIDYEDQYKNTLQCTPQQLIDVLQQWRNVLKNKPQKIILQQDENGDFHIFALPDHKEIEK